MAHLVFQTAYPGDVFLSVPLIKRLRAFDPETPIVLACRPGLGDFFLQNGLVDEVLSVDKKSAKGRDEGLRRILSEEWDYVIVPHQSVRTALWMARVRAKRGKIGFAKWWNRFFFDKRVERPDALPDALRQLSLLASVDGRLAEWFATDEVQALRSPEEQGEVDFRSLPIPDWASMQVKPGAATGAAVAVGGASSAASVKNGATAKSSIERQLVFLAPGSVWGTKRWTAKGYQELARLLLQKGYAVELVGSGAEKELCDQIAAAVPGVINHAGKTSLAGLADLLAKGAALVCNDSGAMHAAAAVGLPTVAIFGPTTLNLGFRPWNENSIVVQRPLTCRPCGAHGPQVCPLGTHACMEEISASQVLAAVTRILNKK